MRRFTVKMRGITVGWSALDDLDDGKRRARGALRPGPGYELVQPIFRLFSDAQGTTSADPTDAAMLARYYAARDRLGLTLHGPGGAAIEPVTVHIVDSTVEAGADALDLEVIADSAEAWRAIAG